MPSSHFSFSPCNPAARPSITKDEEEESVVLLQEKCDCNSEKDMGMEK
jgi:hypothetical protein